MSRWSNAWRFGDALVIPLSLVAEVGWRKRLVAAKPQVASV